MPDNEFRTLERRLMREIAEVEREMARLAREKEVLNRLLHKARKSELAGHEAVRTNSVNRLMAEAAILEHLRNAGRKNGARSDQLTIAVRMTIPDAPRATVSSYLSRLQDRGLIEKGEKYGTWRITEAGTTAS